MSNKPNRQNEKPPIAHGGEIIIREYCECNSPEVRGYTQYYDSPDGCDLRTKMAVTARYGTLVGMVIGTYDVLMYSHVMGVSNIMKRYAAHILPWAGMGMTFAAVAYAVQNYREANDSLNYFVGGFACGPIAGYYLGSRHAVLLGGLALGTIGMIKKWGIDDDWIFMPFPVPHMGTATSWRHDYTLATDPSPVLPLKEAKERCEEKPQC